MHFIDGKPFAPYFIFIKNINEKSDGEILELLELEHCELFDYGDYVHISQDANWVHVIDNDAYQLWYSQKLTNRIEELGKEYEIFTCSVGEPDLSFDFRYFRDGKKIREYVVESPNYDDQIIITDFGSPILGEEILVHEELVKGHQLAVVLHIAESLGIQLPKSAEGIKCYQLEGLD